MQKRRRRKSELHSNRLKRRSSWNHTEPTGCFVARSSAGVDGDGREAGWTEHDAKGKDPEEEMHHVANVIVDYSVQD
jgi:hypothetical protein